MDQGLHFGDPNKPFSSKYRRIDSYQAAIGCAQCRHHSKYYLAACQHENLSLLDAWTLDVLNIRSKYLCQHHTKCKLYFCAQVHLYMSGFVTMRDESLLSITICNDNKGLSEQRTHPHHMKIHNNR